MEDYKIEMKTALIKPTISFSEFEKVDIRTGTIEFVKNIAGSNNQANRRFRRPQT
jgi:hypothetical protein